MTIEVTKPGVLPETIKRSGKCNYCGCEFTFTTADARYSSDQRDGDALVVPCPTCTRDVWTRK